MVRLEVEPEWIKEEDGGTQRLCLLRVDVTRGHDAGAGEPELDDAYLLERLLSFFFSPSQDLLLLTSTFVSFKPAGSTQLQKRPKIHIEERI